MTDLDQTIERLLTTHRTLTVVGASATAGKPAHDVPLQMRKRGYAIVPVNPTFQKWEGAPAFPSLEAAPRPEFVDVFRRAEETPEIARQAVQAGAKVLWLQLGIKNPEARRIAEAGGLTYVEDRCLNVEWKRLRRAGAKVLAANGETA